PAGPRHALEMAHLEQERRHSGERVIILARHREAGLFTDVHAAAGLAADEAFFPQSPDRVADRYPCDAEELRELMTSWKLSAGFELSAEGCGPDRSGDLNVGPPRVLRVNGLHTC